VLKISDRGIFYYSTTEVNMKVRELKNAILDFELTRLIPCLKFIADFVVFWALVQVSVLLICGRILHIRVNDETTGFIVALFALAFSFFRHKGRR